MEIVVNEAILTHTGDHLVICWKFSVTVNVRFTLVGNEVYFSLNTMSITYNLFQHLCYQFNREFNCSAVISLSFWHWLSKSEVLKKTIKYEYKCVPSSLPQCGHKLSLPSQYCLYRNIYRLFFVVFFFKYFFLIDNFSVQYQYKKNYKLIGSEIFRQKWSKS